MTDISLRVWDEGDLGLLRELNAGTPTALGGPESDDAVVDRHRRYTELSTQDSGRMYVVLRGTSTAGSIGFWEKQWQDEAVYETGWHVLPEFRGQGVAAHAAVEIARIATDLGTRKELHAFPPVDNPPSIAVCRKAGFASRGVHDFEYPKGTWIRCEDWWLPL
ncbi:GNAT family N-acetyltransferase [Umezawaea sp. Da 62-37]|uniref:GNAT family N-acetyltransferase n=1 Tax=Umezawaea sp. Da 62-37 TaxID=3075927 RepID=UPI0028F6C058|nr:GNAT family N-acetyltransferase [Umezawaea sp. Da 62-37]WNV86507.1 GNAT family N-acetyltransferase [Umezawaea sp. Da 62-37]